MMSEDELKAAFRRRRLHQIQQVLFDGYCSFVLVFCASLFLVAGTIATVPSVILGLRVFAGVGIPVIFAAKHVSRTDLVKAGALSFAIESGFACYLAYIVRFDVSHSYPGATASAFGFVALCVYVMGIAPGGLRRMALHGALCVLYMAWAISPWPLEGAPYAIVTAAAIVAAASYRMGFFAAIGREGVVELGLLQATAPRSVVQQVAKSFAPVGEIFSATVRNCVCLSSDWRGYQKLSTTLTPAALAATLEAYYNMCEDLLIEAAPEGDYYFDWIADELFVVFFDLGDGKRDLAGRALGFAQRLIAAKGTFVETHPAPLGIDIGVGAGTALVGMLGVPGMSKVTAAGPMQALVRDLQLEAKRMRKQHGDADRIVFGAELRSAAAGAEAIPGRTGLFYLEPLVPEALKSAA